MYHIKSDKRSQSSAEEIVRGLQACLKEKPLKSITVTDIFRATGISRATFYRLFDTPEDVLIYQLDQMTEDTTAVYESQAQLSSAQLMESNITLGLQNHEFLRALVENGRHDLLFQYTEKSFRKLDAAKTIFPQNMDALEREYIIAHLSMALVATQITWARNGQQETAKELMHYLKRYIQIMSDLIGSEA